MASERADLHRSDADEEDDSVKQLKQCSSIYMALQDCLVGTIGIGNHAKRWFGT